MDKDIGACFKIRKNMYICIDGGKCCTKVESGRRVAKECQEFATWVLHEGLLASSLRFKYTEVGKWYGKRKSLGLGPYR